MIDTTLLKFILTLAYERRTLVLAFESMDQTKFSIVFYEWPKGGSTFWLWAGWKCLVRLFITVSLRFWLLSCITISLSISEWNIYFLELIEIIVLYFFSVLLFSIIEIKSQFLRVCRRISPFKRYLLPSKIGFVRFDNCFFLVVRRYKSKTARKFKLARLDTKRNTFLLDLTGQGRRTCWF